MSLFQGAVCSLRAGQLMAVTHPRAKPSVWHTADAIHIFLYDEYMIETLDLLRVLCP